MKYILSILIFFGGLSLQAQTARLVYNPKKAVDTLEASCGSCQFDMPKKACFLAIRKDGKAYEVSGTGLDDHGDAHALDGFCMAIRKAAVQGKIRKGKYVVTYFKLL
jgi:hypothetical protein